MTEKANQGGDNDSATSSPDPLTTRRLVCSSIFFRSMVVLVVFGGLYAGYFFAPRVNDLLGPPSGNNTFDRSIIDYVVSYSLFLVTIGLWIYEDLIKGRRKNKDTTESKEPEKEEVVVDETKIEANPTDEEEGIKATEDVVEETPSDEAKGIEATEDVVEEESKGRKQHPLVTKYLEKRLPYLDSIKVWLIVLVVLAHTTMATSGPGFHPFSPDLATNLTNPLCIVLLVISAFALPFAMSLFFFISGIFTPRSASKRTFAEFLNGKMKRLIFPTMLVYFAIGPLSIMIWNLSTGKGPGNYRPNFITMWFLIYLAIFVLVYAFIAYGPFGSNDASVREWFRKYLRFDTTIFLWIMLIVGVIDGAGTFGLDEINVKFIRMWGYGDALPGWLFYFLLGCFAGQEKWMKRFFEERDPEASETDGRAKSLINCCWYISPVITIATIAAVVLLRIQANLNGDPWNIYETFFLSTLSSLTGFVIIVIILDYSCRKLQSVNLLRLCMMQSAYAVYVFHEVIMNLVIWAWIVILQKAMGIDLVFDEEGNNTTPLSNGVIALGWVFVSVVTQLIVWPFAFFVRKLPILNQIL